MPGKSHGQRSLAGYSAWGYKRVRHDLALNNRQVQARTFPGKSTRVAPWGTGLRLSWTCSQRQDPLPSLTLGRQIHGVPLHGVWSPLAGVAVTVVVHVAMVTTWEDRARVSRGTGGRTSWPTGASLSQPVAPLPQGEARPPTSETVAPCPAPALALSSWWVREGLSGPSGLAGTGSYEETVSTALCN